LLRRDGTLDAKLMSADRSLRAVEIAQMKTLDGLAQVADRQLTGLRGVIAEVGLNPDQLAASAPRPASAAAGGPMGGPLVPLKLDATAGPFEHVVDRLQSVVVTADRLRRSVAALPLGRPMPWDPDVTSGFGVRLDPFTRGYAMHTGIDFRAESGAPVRATAGGRVVTAEYSGGYGNMVEIEHGNGVTTRYAHLSAIAVAEGQSVEAGSVIGRVGSTGRSTGAHLHYETRLSGDPVDPQRFLKAGARLRTQL
jgi:murein DD-endopeptidase MepM/ murein hydrolase activator NlpD